MLQQGAQCQGRKEGKNSQDDYESDKKNTENACIGPKSHDIRGMFAFLGKGSGQGQQREKRKVVAESVGAEKWP